MYNNCAFFQTRNFLGKKEEICLSPMTNAVIQKANPKQGESTTQTTPPKSDI